MIALEKWFEFQNVREEHKVLVTKTLLDGRAKLWADSVTRPFRNFVACRKAFLQEFYFVPIRVRFRNQWLSKRYRHTDGAMQEYFYQQLRAARFVEPEFSKYEINYSIVQQFPFRVREFLASIDCEDTGAVAQILAGLDSTQRERDMERRRGGWDDRYQQDDRQNYRRNAVGVQRIRINNGQKSGYFNNLGNNQSYAQGHRVHQAYGQQCSLPDTCYPPPN